MTRYEYFEKWMTTEEWRTWKELSPSRIRENTGCANMLQARARRREYLMEEVNYIAGSDSRAISDFQEMTNVHIRWNDTPQGHSHWHDLNNRIGPIR